jgi:hypothetical protein
VGFPCCGFDLFDRWPGYSEAKKYNKKDTLRSFVMENGERTDPPVDKKGKRIIVSIANPS